MDSNKKLRLVSEDPTTVNNVTRKVTVLSSSHSTNSDESVMTRTRVILDEYAYRDPQSDDEDFYDSRRKLQYPHPQNYHRQTHTQAHVRTLEDQPHNTLLQSLLNLTSNDHQIRLEAFKTLQNQQSILKICEAEIFKSNSPREIRLTALKRLGEVEIVDRRDLNRVVGKLLLVACEDGAHLIRSQALLCIESLILFNPSHFKTESEIEEGEVEVTKKHKAPKSSKDCEYSLLSGFTANLGDSNNFNVLKKLLPHSLNFSETIFAVLSYVAANDTHRETRLTAMELIGRVTLLSGTVRPEILFGQSVKKDQILFQGNVNKKTQKKTRNKTQKKSKKKSENERFPLLCCGVFAHGIEDQFVKIRFNTLLSLYSLIELSHVTSEFNLVINVFLDALLDECDLIRLASLKFIKRLGPLALSVNSGLEPLLAVLDDQNGEIRREALVIIGENLVLPKIADPKLTVPATVNEMLLRSQRCLEAAVKKYPEMEFEVIEAALKLMTRLAGDVKKVCGEFWSHLMQCSVPKYMTPSSLLPYPTINTSLSNVQSIMQIPFLEGKDKVVRLMRVVSRIPVATNEQRLSLIGNSKGQPVDTKLFKVTGDLQRDFLYLIIRNRSNLMARLVFDQRHRPKNVSFYHFEFGQPVAFFKINSLRLTKDKLIIEDFKLIGSIQKVQIVLLVDDRPVPLQLKFGGNKFVAEMTSDFKSLKIVNKSNDEIIYTF